MERLLAYGDESSLILYLFGALLIDLWNELHVPEPMRTHWAAVVQATLHAPIAADSEQYRRDEDTRRTALDVVKHASSQTLGAAREDVSAPSTNVNP